MLWNAFSLCREEKQAQQTVVHDIKPLLLCMHTAEADTSAHVMHSNKAYTLQINKVNLKFLFKCIGNETCFHLLH